MFTLDTSENVLEGVGRFHAATIRGVAETRRADPQLNGRVVWSDSVAHR